MSEPRTATPWIPPQPLVFAQASLLVSCGLMIAAGAKREFGASPIGFAWIHAVVLGWMSSTALAFLIHVLPTFTDTPLRLERVARFAPWLLQIGVVLIVVGFLVWKPSIVAAGGALVVVGVACALASFFATAAAALRSSDRTTRAVARAFLGVFFFLALTVGIGFALSIGLDTHATFVPRWANVHAALGIFGWLGLLVAGVSMRTYNQLLGNSAGRIAHIATSSLVLVGIALFWAGTLTQNTVLLEAGGAFVAAGAAVNFIATSRSLLRADAVHPLPVEFVAASDLWLLVAIAYAVAGLLGHPYPAALLVAILLGWIGQNLNAHMMHVGVRLIATLVIADDDETPPVELLDRRLGLASLLLWQAAIACGLAALTIGSGALLQAAGALALFGALALIANLRFAARSASLRSA
ncbi:MAG: hypothetical protein ACREMP_00775 [Candidatus Tyrphobacter sp.]